MEWYFFFTSIA